MFRLRKNSITNKRTAPVAAVFKRLLSLGVHIHTHILTRSTSQDAINVRNWRMET